MDKKKKGFIAYCTVKSILTLIPIKRFSDQIITEIDNH
jgi:hypothetical protein